MNCAAILLMAFDHLRLKKQMESHFENTVEHLKISSRVLPRSFWITSCVSLCQSLSSVQQTFGMGSYLLFWVRLKKWWKSELHVRYNKQAQSQSVQFSALGLIQNVPLNVSKEPTPFLFAKNRLVSTLLQLWPCKHLLLCLFDYRKTDTALHGTSFVYMYYWFLHMCTPGTWGLEWKWSVEAPKFLCPSLRSCGAPALSLTQNVCSHTVAHHSAIYNPPHPNPPSLQFGFKEWCDRKAGCRQILTELPGFSEG